MCNKRWRRFNRGFEKGSENMSENKRFILSDRRLSEVGNDIAIADWGVPCTQRQVYKLLNELAEENEQLKQQKDKWKQQCIHFKEMLDDMDIAYLCDEWIYEELKGDVE